MSLPVAEAPAAAGAPPAAPPPAPLATRVVDTFFSPVKVFEQLREGPAPWVGPVLVCAALLVIVTLVRPLFISDQQMAEAALEQMRRMGVQTLPTAEEMAGRMSKQALFGLPFAVAWAFLRVWLWALVVFAVFALGLGGRNQIRPYAAVASHAYLVPTLGFCLVAALQYATGRLDLTLDAALLVPGLDPAGVAAGVLHGITPWGVWFTALLALGGATVNRRKGWVGVAALLFSLQMALVLAFALVTHMAQGRAAAG